MELPDFHAPHRTNDQILRPVSVGEGLHEFDQGVFIGIAQSRIAQLIEVNRCGRFVICVNN